MEKANIPVREDLLVETSPGYAGGYEAAKILLTRLDRPSAIFAMSDYRSIGVIRAAHELGVKIPEELSLVGFGGMPAAEYTNPPLTTIENPYYEMSFKGAAMLQERMKNKDLPQREIVFETRLIVRASTAVYKGTPCLNPVRLDNNRESEVTLMQIPGIHQMDYSTPYHPDNLLNELKRYYNGAVVSSRDSDIFLTNRYKSVSTHLLSF